MIQVDIKTVYFEEGNVGVVVVDDISRSDLPQPTPYLKGDLAVIVSEEADVEISQSFVGFGNVLDDKPI